MVTITRVDQLEAWLESKPAEVAVVIAQRAALRMLPFACTPAGGEHLTLASFRALFVSRAAAIWPDIEMAEAADAADDSYRYVANIDLPVDTRAYYSAYPLDYHEARNLANTAYSASRAAARAARAGADATRITTAIVHARYLAHNDFSDFDIATSISIWESITADATWIDVQFAANPEYSPSQILETSLWPNSFSTGTVLTTWQDVRSKLLDQIATWEIWLNWYERRLRGEQLDFDDLTPNGNKMLCIAVAKKPNAFWERPASEVNQDIKSMLEEVRIPLNAPSQPASVRPVWREGRMVQPDTATSNLNAPSVHDIAEALSLDFEGLINDLENRNVERSALTLLKSIVRNLTQTSLGRVHIFRLANRLLELQDYAAKVSQEWPDEDKARYNALTIQLDRLLSTFPEIQEYFLALPKPKRTIEEIEQFMDAAEEIISSLRSVEAAPIIDLSVTDALDIARQDVRGDLGVIYSSLSREPRAVSSFENLVVGVSNFMGTLLERAQKSLGDEIGKHADNAGPYATKLIIYLYQHLTKAGIAAGTGTAASLAAATTQIEVLSQASHPLGLAVGLITFIALKQKKAGG